MSQVLHGFWREVGYLWRTSKLPRDFFEVSQIWLYRGGTACVICLRASLVERHDNACYSCEHCASAAMLCRQHVQASLEPADIAGVATLKLP